MRIKDWTRNDFLVYMAFHHAAAREVDAGRVCVFCGIIPEVYFTIGAVELELLSMTSTAIYPLTEEEIHASISNLASTMVKVSDGDDIVFPALFYTPEELSYLIDPDEYKDMTEEKKKEKSIVSWSLSDGIVQDPKIMTAMVEEFVQAGIDGIVFTGDEEGTISFSIIPEPVTKEEIMRTKQKFGL